MEGEAVRFLGDGDVLVTGDLPAKARASVARRTITVIMGRVLRSVPGRFRIKTIKQ